MRMDEIYIANYLTNRPAKMPSYDCVDLAAEKGIFNEGSHDRRIKLCVPAPSRSQLRTSLLDRTTIGNGHESCHGFVGMGNEDCPGEQRDLLPANLEFPF